MAKILHKARTHISDLKQKTIKQMLTLATSGFGLVAALAWNQFIQEAVNTYIEPLIGGASGIISLFIYAVLVTILAVIVTYNLTRLVNKK